MKQYTNQPPSTQRTREENRDCQIIPDARFEIKVEPCYDSPPDYATKCDTPTADYYRRNLKVDEDHDAALGYIQEINIIEVCYLVFV